jgi:hypothetical protein
MSTKRARRCGGQQRQPLQRLKIEVAPAFALAARKTEFGKPGDAAPAVAGEPSRLDLRGMADAAIKGVEIRPRLGLYREIDDWVHRRLRRSAGAHAAPPASSSKGP